jgi:hypothetical protein
MKDQFTIHNSLWCADHGSAFWITPVLLPSRGYYRCRGLVALSLQTVEAKLLEPTLLERASAKSTLFEDCKTSVKNRSSILRLCGVAVRSDQKTSITRRKIWALRRFSWFVMASYPLSIFNSFDSSALWRIAIFRIWIDRGRSSDCDFVLVHLLFIVTSLSDFYDVTSWIVLCKVLLRSMKSWKSITRILPSPARGELTFMAPGYVFAETIICGGLAQWRFAARECHQPNGCHGVRFGRGILRPYLLLATITISRKPPMVVPLPARRLHDLGSHSPFVREWLQLSCLFASGSPWSAEAWSPHNESVYPYRHAWHFILPRVRVYSKLTGQLRTNVSKPWLSSRSSRIDPFQSHWSVTVFLHCFSRIDSQWKRIHGLRGSFLVLSLNRISLFSIWTKSVTRCKESPRPVRSPHPPNKKKPFHFYSRIYSPSCSMAHVRRRIQS